MTPNLGFGQNPYIQQQAQALQQQSNQNLAQNVMPAIGQGAQAAGQYGSTRQGIAQGVAAGNAQAGVNAAQAGLYSNAYQTDQAANLQQQGLDNSLYLGKQNVGLQQQGLDNSLYLGKQNVGLQQQGLNNSLFLGNQGQMQNFYTANRGLDQSGMQLGANLYNAGNTGNLAAGAGQTALGQQYQGAGINAAQQYANTLSPYSGLGGGQVTTGTSGGGAMGAIGGALAGAQLGKNLGFGGSSSGSFSPGSMGTALADNSSWYNSMIGM